MAHTNAHFKPTRDFNADDVIFSIERQWKEDHPVLQGHELEPLLLQRHGHAQAAEVGREGRRLHGQDHAEPARGAVPVRPRDGVRRHPVEGIRRRDAEGRHAGEDRPGADRHRARSTSCSTRRTRSSATRRFPRLLGRQGEDRRPRLRDHAGRLGALGQAAEGRMPRDALSEPGRPRRDAARTRTSRCSSSRASTSAISPTTRRRSRSTTCACARPLNMAINKKAIIDAVYLAHRHRGEEPDPAVDVVLQRRRSRTTRTIRKRAKKLLAEAGFPNGFETDLWAMPVQRPYNPNARRIAELMQADLAKVGVKAEIKSFEWGEYRKRMQAGEHQTGMLGWTGDNGDPDNFLHTLLGCDAAKTGGGNIAQVVLPAVRRPGQEGQVDQRPGRAHQALRAGAGDLQGAGAVVHDRPCGAAEAGAQGSGRLQALAVRPPHLLRRRHRRADRSDTRSGAALCTPAPLLPDSFAMLRFILTRAQPDRPDLHRDHAAGVLPHPPCSRRPDRDHGRRARHRPRAPRGAAPRTTASTGRCWCSTASISARLLHGDLGKSIDHAGAGAARVRERCSRRRSSSRSAPSSSPSSSACRPASWPRCGATRSSTTA